LLGQKGVSGIGDASSAVLADGSWFVGACCDGNSGAALATGTALHWKSTGTGKADGYDEEAFTLLPNGKVLTVDLGIPKSSELYDETTGAWTPAGNTVVDFSNNACYEIGPSVLRPDGTVLQVGANTHNAVYNSITGVWKKAPDTPGLASTDGPASILPSGNVLVEVAPYITGSECYGHGAVFYEWNGTKFLPVPGPASGTDYPTFITRMLALPNGQIMLTNYSGDVEFYSASGGPKAAWAPTITKISSKKIKQNGLGFLLTGTQFNGFSQGAAYGDDFQNATNYPLVRITNNATGHVFYCRTYNHSSMGVATGSTVVTTHFGTPAGIELGASQLVVVANGIPSAPLAVTIIP
jgi:hypothetical protein